MNNEHTSRVEVEFSIGWAANNPELFEQGYNDFFSEYNDGWKITSGARPGFLTLIAERIAFDKNVAKLSIVEKWTAEDENASKSGWLRSGSLLYRLTNERTPQNRDEINVTMAQGSRGN
jgi:hypothetical protein